MQLSKRFSIPSPRLPDWLIRPGKALALLHCNKGQSKAYPWLHRALPDLSAALWWYMQLFNDLSQWNMAPLWFIGLPAAWLFEITNWLSCSWVIASSPQYDFFLTSVSPFCPFAITFSLPLSRLYFLFFLYFILCCFSFRISSRCSVFITHSFRLNTQMFRTYSQELGRFSIQIIVDQRGAVLCVK